MNTYKDPDFITVSEQLEQIITVGAVDEGTPTRRHIKEHPLLKTGSLVGSLSIRAENDIFHLNLTHTVPRQPTRLRLTQTHISIEAGGEAEIEITPFTTTPNTLTGQLCYAKSAYLPQGLVQEFKEAEGLEVVKARLELSSAFELAEFIRATHTNRRAD